MKATGWDLLVVWICLVLGRIISQHYWGNDSPELIAKGISAQASGFIMLYVWLKIKDK